ncbi:hypothetical protein [Lysinibacillus piscis]|uniref:Uncharacterized protein n=1 Tax=Lysinibacillus piscis TaxID=2518931 RepID=A0ABQ5NQ52_9BACI|nr:hypothetical protein [Lysinibacillus sp. KH24]GLC90474.1 hypothetical protein LYSBPC_36010 [Lysinibacillus sp. KH24]
MKNEIKKGLLDITPNLQQSKTYIQKAVLSPQKNKKQLWPQAIFICFLLLSIIFLVTEWQTSYTVEGFSEETLKMYSLLQDGDATKEYQQDLLLVKYGQQKGIIFQKQSINKLITTYEAQLPSTFDKVLNKEGITKAAYREQFLTLQAQVQLIYDTLLPQYEKIYPQFHHEIYGQLLLLDAMEELKAESMPFGTVTTIPAIVLYENNNTRILALLEKKRLLEEQVIIMPKRDTLSLKTGTEVLLQNSFLTDVQTKTRWKQFVVSQDITVATANKTIILPAMQKQVDAFFQQTTWESLSQTAKPDMQLQTLHGDYSVWYGKDIILGLDHKQFTITKEMLTEWGENFIQN